MRLPWLGINRPPIKASWKSALPPSIAVSALSMNVGGRKTLTRGFLLKVVENPIEARTLLRVTIGAIHTDSGRNGDGSWGIRRVTRQIHPLETLTFRPQ